MLEAPDDELATEPVDKDSHVVESADLSLANIEPAFEGSSSVEPADHESTAMAASPATTAPAADAIAPHPQAAEIIRQVDYYFSEENLRQDAHLLGLIQSGNGLVSLHEILGWRKMRRFRPATAVREALRESRVVEVVGNKQLRRREPLEGPVYVVPEVKAERQRKAVPEDKPWLTPGLMKPTGFEEGATDGPIRPDEWEKDREAYAEGIMFTDRIETAIMRFCARRKWHQTPRAVWEKFLHFGGFNANQRQFTGGLDDKSMEEYSKKEIAELTSYYAVSDMVINGLYADGPDGMITWVVDFEALAKAFLSSHFTACFDWQNQETVVTATTVLRSFYNYLLHHDVCPEYREQLYAARAVCDQAAAEFPRLKEASLRLPGSFNTACSTLHGGSFAGMYATGDWVREEDKMGWSDKDAHVIFAAGIAAHGTEAQMSLLEVAKAEGTSLKVESKEQLGLEVVRIIPSEGAARAVYEDPLLKDTFVRPMGKLICKRWEVPHAAPRDIPEWAKRQGKDSAMFEFLIEDSSLECFYPGLKYEAVVHKLELGIQWIDRLETTYPSFFVWLPNERIREHRRPGPPKAWMKRANTAMRLRRWAEDDGVLEEHDRSGDGAVLEEQDGSGDGAVLEEADALGDDEPD